MNRSGSRTTKLINKYGALRGHASRLAFKYSPPSPLPAGASAHSRGYGVRINPLEIKLEFKIFQFDSDADKLATADQFRPGAALDAHHSSESSVPLSGWFCAERHPCISAAISLNRLNCL